MPVLASRIDGNVGLLGADYAGYFPVGDAAALAALMRRFVADAGFAAHLARAVRAREPLFRPAVERRAVRALVADRSLRARAAALRESRSVCTLASTAMNAPTSDRRSAPTPLRLTSFSHGGGCGCKIAPGVLSEILRSSAGGIVPPELMVGIETADDAAVYQLNDEQALIATTDFFMPIVDDPFDFGRIAATNAISDVYAMGGRPIMALALVAMPIDKLTRRADRPGHPRRRIGLPRRPASRSPAATPSIRSSRSTAWS